MADGGEDNGTATDGYGTVGEQYDRRRPGYPPAAFQRLQQVARLPAGAQILEIGPGTGQATRWLLNADYDVTGVEPDARLIDIARQRLVGLEDQLTLHHGRFEDTPLPASHFDLVLAATSWHWLDPDIAPHRAADALRPGGTVALLWNAHTHPADDPFQIVRRRMYREVAPQLEHLAPLHPDDPHYDPTAALVRSGRFGPVRLWQHAHHSTYTTSGYLELLDTYASHRALTPATRDLLHARLADCIDTQFNGTVTVPYDVRLYTAQASPDRDG